ncbi:hypothetical protein ASZ90_010781 [hydrocarbon metagenome]|uniref:Uncharacterized protein n=1 Tax=hydrocarbon metagenome TaxID=938273 RepID=A0A0W8FF15_9ZZZZ
MKPHDAPGHRHTGWKRMVMLTTRFHINADEAPERDCRRSR